MSPRTCRACGAVLSIDVPEYRSYCNACFADWARGLDSLMSVGVGSRPSFPSPHSAPPRPAPSTLPRSPAGSPGSHLTSQGGRAAGEGSSYYEDKLERDWEMFALSVKILVPLALGFTAVVVIAQALGWIQ